VHIVACVVYGGKMPTGVAWWVMNVVSAIIMAVAGEYVCMHADMASHIEVNSPRKERPPNVNLL